MLGYDQGVMSGIVSPHYCHGSPFFLTFARKIGAENQFGQDLGHPGPTTQGTIVRCGLPQFGDTELMIL